jgi:hypothetical protein
VVSRLQSQLSLRISETVILLLAKKTIPSCWTVGGQQADSKVQFHEDLTVLEEIPGSSIHPRPNSGRMADLDIK